MRTKVIFGVVTLVALAVAYSVFGTWDGSSGTRQDSREVVYIAHVAFCAPDAPECSRTEPVTIEVSVAGIPQFSDQVSGPLFEKEFRVPRGGVAELVAEQSEPGFLRCWWTQANGKGIGRPHQIDFVGTATCPLRALP